MTTAAVWRAAMRARRNALTQLNLETSARYALCVKSGGHVPSGERVVRSFPIGERSLKLCAKCGVPIAGRQPGYWGDPTSGAKGGRNGRPS